MKSTNELVSIRLTVNNHPGVMSHVCGLFARRAFNLEGILVTLTPDGKEATVWLLVHADDQLDQMLSQIRKLYDVNKVALSGIDENVFPRLNDCMHSLECETV